MFDLTLEGLVSLVDVCLVVELRTVLYVIMGNFELLSNVGLVVKESINFRSVELLFFVAISIYLEPLFLNKELRHSG